MTRLNEAYKYIVHFPNETDRSPCIVRTLEEAIDQATWRCESRRYPGIIDAYHNPTKGIEHVTLKEPTIVPNEDPFPRPVRYQPHPLVFLCYQPTPESSPLQDVVIVTLTRGIEGGYSRTPLSVLQQTLTDKERPLPCFITANASAAYEAQRYTTAPVQITREQFWEALECLPPENWRNTGDGESFRSCEYLTGNITTHYVHVGDTYWSFTAERTSHEDAIRRVLAQLPTRPQPTAQVSGNPIVIPVNEQTR